MLRQIRRALIFFIAGIASVAGLRWWQIRTGRKPAPHPDDLMLNPDTHLRLSRNSEALRIEWARESSQASIYLGLSPDTIDRDKALVVVENTHFVTLTDIDPTQRYFVEVRFDDGEYLLAGERILPLKTVQNFRDIGGYRAIDGRQLRWNRVFRAASLDSLSDDDLERFIAMNVQLVCDVRTTEEMLNHPDRIPDTITLMNVPPHSNDSPWVQLLRILFWRNFLETALFKLYTYVLIDNNPQLFATIFKQLAEESNLPMLIHCAAGKDRTGMVIAVLLKMLGVADKTIIADYSLSNRSYEHSRKAAGRAFVSLKVLGLREEELAYLLIADSTVMQRTLDYIDSRYGSVEAYLVDYVGLSRETIQSIRNNLLE
jgi:protein-tyrosine phosphatase